MNLKKISLFIFAVIVNLSVHGQNAKLIMLYDAINIAQKNSLDSKVAETQDQVKFYEFIQYKSDLRPQVLFNSEIPTFTKSFTPIIQPNGSIQYLPVKQNTNFAGLSLSQLIPGTEGTISLNTELSQFYDFQNNYNQFNGTPVFLRYSQPLFAFKEYKWKKKIEPLKLEGSKRAYIQELENIAQKVTGLYFSVLEAENDIAAAKVNLENSRKNYEIEKQRIPLGTTSEDRLLQLELVTLRSEQDLFKANSQKKTAMLNFQTYIGSNHPAVSLILPQEIPRITIDVSKAIEYAKRYRPEYIEFERKKLEAMRDVEKVKNDSRQVNLSASYGLNRASSNLSTIYSDPKSQQLFSLGVAFPVIDWGRQKARYKTFMANEKLIEFSNSSESLRIENEITTLIYNIELYRGNIALSKMSDSVAKRRFAIASGLYQIGKLSITDINIAQQEKDSAGKDYIEALRSFWESFFLLRRLTMFDFIEDKPITNGFVDYKERK